MHTRIWQRVVLSGLLGATLIGGAAFARPDAEKSKQPGKQVAAPPAEDSAAETARRSETVATFDAAQPGSRDAITLGELEDAASTTGTFNAQRPPDKAALKAVLDRTLRFELLAAEAERRGYDKNVSVVQSVKQNAVQSMLKQEVDAKVTPQSVSADAVKKYYDDHISEFVRPEFRRASQVVVATEEEAKALLEQAKTADMRGFRELARLKSKDETSKLRGGDLRYFDAKGQPDQPGAPVDPALAKAAFALKNTGDASGVLKTDAGFVLLKLTGIRPAHEEKLKDADERIRMRLWREQREAAIDAMLTTLKQNSPPTTHAELLDAINFGPDPAGPPNAGLPSGFPHTKPPPVPIPKQ